jgi:hypothetical protein
LLILNRLSGEYSAKHSKFFLNYFSPWSRDSEQGTEEQGLGTEGLGNRE